MATYAIGDVQGCAATLERLLARCGFSPARDRLWLVGDLVNRGPGSLAVLRRVRDLGERAVAVLGNHDLHLLARAAGVAAARPGDTLDEVLGAPDRDELLAWLRARPLLHREGSWVLVHAGLLPAWTVDEAAAAARAAEALLRGPRAADVLARVKRHPALLALTRLRTCTADGTPSLSFKDHPRDAPPGFQPWFEVPGRRSESATIVFGHWAALGLHIAPGLYGLDTGCCWGHHLTALRLDDRTLLQEPVQDPIG
jgi:bis(5'-nucleosyl)-tetraphosphatase (symmetrical)